MLLGYLRQQWLIFGIYADVFNLRESIASETAIKLTYQEIGILRRHGRHKKKVFLQEIKV